MHPSVRYSHRNLVLRAGITLDRIPNLNMPAAVETGRKQMIMGLEGRRVPQFARRTAYNERALCVCRDNARLTHAEHLLLSSDLLQMQHRRRSVTVSCMHTEPEG